MMIHCLFIKRLFDRKIITAVKRGDKLAEKPEVAA